MHDYLGALNDDPAPLAAHLAAEAPHAGRLGRYAESLLAFWLARAPHSRLLARNVRVSDGSNTGGEIDFAAEIDGTPYHIELACKYYGAADGAPDALAGLNPRDCFQDKAAKLHSQLALPHSAAGRAALAAAGVPENLRSVSILRGVTFAAADTAWQPPLNPLGWHGLYFDEWPSENPFQTACATPPIPPPVLPRPRPPA